MRRDPRIFWGLLLIGGGILFLLQNLGIFQGGDLFWGIVFGVGGALFLSTFVTNRANWWALIPGMTLLGLAVMILLGVFAPSVREVAGGSIFLGSIGLSFWLIYMSNRQQWWAVIPGGTMLTLAAVAGLPDRVGGPATGGLFFLGLGLTFMLLAALPTPQGRMRWPLIPGGILAVMGLLIAIGFGQGINYIWPVALILVGLYLVARTFGLRRG
ncbi:MAG: hypothetical protein ACRDH2_10970 [Anaerolineales bacterium]